MSSASTGPEGAAQAQWAGRSRGTPLGHRIFLFLIRYVGLGAAYGLLMPVCLWFTLFARAPGRAWERYYARIRPKDRSPRWLVRFKAYHTFGKLLMDKAAITGGLRERFTTTHIPEDLLQRIMDAGAGGLVISAHIGNWQMASYMLKRYKGNVSIVMLDAEVEAIKQVHEQASEDRRFEVIPLKPDMSHLFRIRGALAEGRLVCLHGDRAMPGSRTAVKEFLGAPAAFPLGPFAIAAAFDVPVCFAFVVRTGARKYTLQATAPLPADRDAKVHLDRFVNALERIADEYPFQWANFYDFWNDDQATTAPGGRRAHLPTAPTTDRAGG
ncbi:MAG: hypothetical protein IPK99_14620 [Flavobacteriales bacterium]|nr:hypothetical protein [Flavobacteriales bacterium]